MALKGTIKDFGVADIFQLISQQAKTGVLVLNNDVDEVRVYFLDGSVVRASNTIRTAQMLLGTLMVQAEVITDEQLHAALKEQQRTLRRLGAVMVELRYASAEAVREFATLQMTETIYALFEWKIGTYEFESVDVEPSPEGVQPIRAETIVMNGIRMTDEWPGVREKIPSYGWQVERVRELPKAPVSDANISDEIDFSMLNDDVSSSSSSSSFDDIGRYERLVYGLLVRPLTVRKVIDLSRLGEFEACRALSTLMGAGYIRIVKPIEIPAEPEVARVGPRDRVVRALVVLGRVVLSASLVVLAFAIASHAIAFVGADAPTERLDYTPDPARTRLAKTQIVRLRRALEVYRFERGAYPPVLDRLVEVGILRELDLHYPFERPYYYRLSSDADTYTLLPPLR